MLTLDSRPPAVALTSHRFTVFNGTAHLFCAGPPAESYPAVEARLRRLESRFSRFLPGNELGDLNESCGRWVEIAADLENLLRHALEVAVRSGGLVNIATTGALLRAGYRRPWPQPWDGDVGQEGVAPLPPLTEVLEIRRGRARLSPGHQVDFGALAKGWWADETVDRLGPNAAVSLGGDVSARGDGPDGVGWPIAVPGGRTVLVRDGGIATSGTTKRRSGTAHHLIDPRTGAPARSGIQEVTVLATNGGAAEWLATAAAIDPAARCIDEAPELQKLWVSAPERTGEEHA